MPEKIKLCIIVCEQNGDRSNANIQKVMTSACMEKLIKVLW